MVGGGLADGASDGGHSKRAHERDAGDRIFLSTSTTSSIRKIRFDVCETGGTGRGQPDHFRCGRVGGLPERPMSAVPPDSQNRTGRRNPRLGCSEGPVGRRERDGFPLTGCPVNERSGFSGMRYSTGCSPGPQRSGHRPPISGPLPKRMHLLPPVLCSSHPAVELAEHMSRTTERLSAAPKSRGYTD